MINPRKSPTLMTWTLLVWLVYDDDNDDGIIIGADNDPEGEGKHNIECEQKL